MNRNQIYLRLGRAKKYKQQSTQEESKPSSPIKIFLIKCGVVLLILYFSFKYIMNLIL